MMREYAFDHEPVLGAGRAVFRIWNAGRLTHHLIVVALAQDPTPVSELFGGRTRRRAFSPLAIIPNQPGGARTAFALDLVPGRYALICLVQDGDGMAHTRKGMSSDLRVRGVPK